MRVIKNWPVYRVFYDQVVKRKDCILLNYPKFNQINRGC